jgi:exopolyphosphatase/guanosine-5'-triphosphate,3'-diphosphate pyrophosphatase
LHSHYIISHAGLLGFDPQEIRIMANIARFHRKKLPSKKALKSERLDEKSQEAIIILSTFLRFAEKLDRSHCSLVNSVEFMKENKDTVIMQFHSEANCSLEEWSISQNKKAFYNAFDKNLETKCIVELNP